MRIPPCIAAEGIRYSMVCLLSHTLCVVIKIKVTINLDADTDAYTVVTSTLIWLYLLNPSVDECALVKLKNGETEEHLLMISKCNPPCCTVCWHQVNCRIRRGYEKFLIPCQAHTHNADMNGILATIRGLHRQLVCVTPVQTWLSGCPTGGYEWCTRVFESHIGYVVSLFDGVEAKQYAMRWLLLDEPVYIHCGLWYTWLQLWWNMGLSWEMVYPGEAVPKQVDRQGRGVVVGSVKTPIPWSESLLKARVVPGKFLCWNGLMLY